MKHPLIEYVVERMTKEKITYRRWSVDTVLKLQNNTEITADTKSNEILSISMR